MAKTHGQVNANAGRVESRRVRRAREVDFPVTIVNTPAKRLARSLWG